MRVRKKRSLPAVKAKLDATIRLEMQTAVEQLQVAEEELRLQNEELSAHKEALEAERHRYADLFEFAPNAYFITDLSGVVTEANRAAAELLNIERRALIGKPLALFTEESRSGWLQDEIRRITGISHATRHSLRLRRRTNELFFAAVTAATIRTPEGKPVGIRWLMHDDTRRRETEEEIRRLNRDLEQRTQQLEQRTRELESASRVKDYFLAMLSHELRTPLTPVLAVAEAMENRADVPDEVKEDSAMIRRNVALEARLIDDLLDLTRVAWGKLRLETREVDADEILRHTVEIVEGDWKAKGQQFTIELGARDHHLKADPARLQQIFWNVLKNAVRFTPAGGSIAVRTNNPSADLLVVEITDDGAGIDPEAIDRIFLPFEQAHERTLSDRASLGGLGLGLSISKKLVEAHGGVLRAQSLGKGRGSTFTIQLPVARRNAKPKAIAAGAAKPANGKRNAALRILLVEDHADTARIMGRLLGLRGYAVRTAHSLAEAMEAARAETFDMMVSDIGLPDGTGLDLMGQVRAIRPEIKGIALSGFGTEDDLNRSREAGFESHVTKPVDLEKLRGEIERVAGGGGVMLVE